MTANQINYQRNVENRRSNLANEALTAARDRVNADLGYKNLAELGRHNLAAEKETNRSNLANEEIRRQYNYITQTHYDRSDSIQISKLAADVVNQALNRQESIRHNVSTEQETKRHNVAVERETGRSNVAQEGLGKDRVELGYVQNSTGALTKANPYAGSAYAVGRDLGYLASNHIDSNQVSALGQSLSNNVKKLMAAATALGSRVPLLTTASGLFN